MAQDLLMETLHDAPQSLRRFARRSTVKTFLYRIALNKWKEARRNQERRTELIRENYTPAGERDLNLTLALEQAMATLPDVLREAFVLVRVEGLKYREAADLLDVPIGTIQSRVHSACELLRGQLQEELR